MQWLLDNFKLEQYDKLLQIGGHSIKLFIFKNGWNIFTGHSKYSSRYIYHEKN